MKTLTITLFSLVVFFASCKKDSNNSNSGNRSRVIRFEVSGNFTGTFTAVYTHESGGVASQEVTTLPWSKEITYAASVPSASIGISGRGGAAGQKVTFVIKRGGVQVGTAIEQVVNSAGAFTIAGQPIVF